MTVHDAKLLGLSLLVLADKRRDESRRFFMSASEESDAVDEDEEETIDREDHHQEHLIDMLARNVVNAIQNGEFKFQWDDVYV